MRLRGKKPIFDIRDTYSLNSVLSPIIAAGLKRFREVSEMPDFSDRFGTPIEIYCEFGEEQAAKEWKNIIDKMIYAFDVDEPVAPNSIFSCDDSFENYKSLCDDHHKKVQEGLELFAKYYLSLWW